MPALIQQHWLNPAAAGYLAASNLLGYLLAVALLNKMLPYYSLLTLIKTALVLAVLSLSFCAINGGFAWLVLWRFTAGIAGAMLIVLTPAATLTQVPTDYKGRAAGILFTGIGLGIIASGLIFPLLAKQPVAYSWLIAAGIAFILSLFAWPRFKTMHANTIAHHVTSVPSVILQKSKTILWLMSIAYLLYGIGMVPHTLFLVTYLHSTYHASLVLSGLFWALFGFGATLGPISVGLVADKIGTYKSLVLCFMLATLTLIITLFTPRLTLCLATTFLMGMLLPAIPSLLSARIFELPPEQHPLFWGRSALYCAISQAVAAYLMAYLLPYPNAYFYCLLIATGAFLFGLLAMSYCGVKQLGLHPDA